jgi:hypothetical protein
MATGIIGKKYDLVLKKILDDFFFNIEMSIYRIDSDFIV